jgi:regulator of replication initiation timing
MKVDFEQLPLEDEVKQKGNFVLKRSPFLIFLPILFLVVGASAGFAIWQMSRNQEQQRSLSSTKTLLDQTTQQVQFLKKDNETALLQRNKLLKDLQTSQQQLMVAKKQNTALQQQVKAFQEQLNILSADNSKLRTQIVEAQQQQAAFSKTRTSTPIFKNDGSNPNSNFIPPP